MKKIFLSFSLSAQTPSYGNYDSLIIDQTKSIACGDSCNQVRLTLGNHIGTHVDCPSHFDATGKTIDQYSAEFWFVKNIAYLEIPAEMSQIIELEAWGDKISDQAEALIIKTGFCHKRSESLYWQNNPGLSAASGKFLREKFPRIRMIGFDFISLSSFENRIEGRKAHQEFLREDKFGNPILIIEDMDLRELHQAPLSLIVIPLRVQGLDGAPVTVVAEV